MKNPFFEPYTNEVSFQNTSALHKWLDGLDASVPRRTEGRTSDHRERFCLRIYLAYLSQHGMLSFPLVIAKSEAPDFFLRANKIVAVEVTEAGTEDHQQAMTELEKSPAGTLLEAGTNRLVGHKDRLIGKGWEGDAVELEWVELMLNAVDNKVHSLNRPHFQSADTYELVIYDNSHLATMLHVADALPVLKERIGQLAGVNSAKKMFHSVSMIHHGELRHEVWKSVPGFAGTG